MFDNTVLDIQSFNDINDTFVLFCSDKKLYLSDKVLKHVKEIAYLPKVNVSDVQIKIYTHYPYVCVSERYGLNAVVVNMQNGTIKDFTREDYHADVSSYSIGFLELNGEPLLIHQTKWNRLDITNLHTGKLLTDREIYCIQISKGYIDKEGKPVSPKYDEKNYLDYFHSLIHVSPDYKNFILNGWVWHPVGVILCSDTEKFFTSYEPGSVGIDYAKDYNWDRPCTFIDNNTFVIAVDYENIYTQEDKPEDEEYKQLWFYDLNNVRSKTLECCKKVACDVFRFNNEREVAGELYYDKSKNVLIAINDKGGSVVSLEGKILALYPELAIPIHNSMDYTRYSSAEIWKYNTGGHFFYKYSNDKKQINIVEIV